VRLFVAGATGVLGRALVPLLVGAGHDVTGTTRFAEKTAAIEELGATPVVVDAYDADALRDAVAAARPEIVLHLLTDLTAQDFAANARLRREATPNLVDAALAAGARRLLAESIAFATNPEGDAAVAELERLVTQTPPLEGVVFRYGRLYGPGTWFETELPESPRVSVEAAAHATLAALEHAPRGVIEVVD
jgi:nucleoside-diphosphate-sugar epimerase